MDIQLIWTHPDNTKDITPECDPKFHGTAWIGVYTVNNVNVKHCVYCGKVIDEVSTSHSDFTQYELTKARQNETGSTA